MRLTINVEDSRVNFFIELLKSLAFVTIETKEEEMSDEEKKFIEYRLAHHEANRDKAILWDDLKKQLEQTL
jgi:Putative addiction module component